MADNNSTGKGLSQVSGLRRRSNNRIDAVAVARNLSQSSACGDDSPHAHAHAQATFATSANGSRRSQQSFATSTNGSRHPHARGGRTLSDISDRSLTFSDADTDADADQSSDCSVDIDALSAASASASDGESDCSVDIDALSASASDGESDSYSDSESHAFLHSHKKKMSDEEGGDADDEATTFVTVAVATSDEAWYNRPDVRTAAHAVTIFVACYGFVMACHNNACDYMFKCRCTWYWTSGSHDCNMHDKVGPRCPWCMVHPKYYWIEYWVPIVSMFLCDMALVYSQTFNKIRDSMSTTRFVLLRLAASMVVFWLTHAVVGWIFMRLVDPDYPYFFWINTEVEWYAKRGLPLPGAGDGAGVVGGV